MNFLSSYLPETSHRICCAVWGTAFEEILFLKIFVTHRDLLWNNAS